MSAAAGTVLLTGATGMVGRHAWTALKRRGFEVIAVAREGTPIAGDLLDADTRRALVRSHRPSHWLHLAWETRHGYFWSAPENDQWLAASLDLLSRFVDAGGRRVVVAGTCAEYDWRNIGRRPIAESAPLLPSTRYGATKKALHAELAERAKAGGFTYAWGRLFLLVGAGEHPDRLVPSLARALLAGNAANCTAGDQMRDFMDSRDAGEAFAALAESDVNGPVNIASGEAHSVGEVALTLGRLAGRLDLVRLGALPMRPDDPPFLVADTTRLSQELKFRPRIGFEPMLTQALERWR